MALAVSLKRFSYFLTTALYLHYRAVISFFISFMILSNAAKTIANAIKYVILSTITYNTPCHKGAETAATVSLHLTL
jgi:multidrug transporter EmrE-like cation transporter